MKTPEIDILNEFGKHMVGLGAEVFTEVRVPEIGLADMVISTSGPDGRVYNICEGKKEMTYHLLWQCIRWRGLCSQVIAVTPFKNLDEPYDLAVEHFQKYRIAIASPNGIMNGLRVPKPEQDGIKEFLRPSQLWKPDSQPFARAGQSSGRRASERGEAWVAIEEWVRQNEGCTLAAAAKAGNLKAMALSKLIRSGQVKLREKIVGGKAQLFTND